MVGGGNYSHIARVLLSAPKQTKNDKKKSQLFKKANLWQINLSKNTFTFIQYMNLKKIQIKSSSSTSNKRQQFHI